MFLSPLMSHFKRHFQLNLGCFVKCQNGLIEESTKCVCVRAKAA